MTLYDVIGEAHTQIRRADPRIVERLLEILASSMGIYASKITMMSDIVLFIAQLYNNLLRADQQKT